MEGREMKTGNSQRKRRETDRRVGISHAVTKALQVWGERTNYHASTTLASEIERQLNALGFRITRKPASGIECSACDGHSTHVDSGGDPACTECDPDTRCRVAA
jgi:hypothetical protein